MSRRAVRAFGAAATLFTLGVTACERQDPIAPRVTPSAPLLDRHDDNNSSSGVLIVPQGAPLATFNGVPINHGGYGSALAVRGEDANVFYSMSDRGANVALSAGIGFGVPGFTPQIGKFRRQGNKLTLIGTILLRKSDGSPLTGLPHPNAEANRTEAPFTLDGMPLTPDPLGIDSEGLAFESNGSFWVSDEYGPDVVHFSREGRTLKRLSPGSGLPLVLAHRRVNRGMEGLALTPNGRTLVGMMQSPLDNPTAGGSSAGRTSRFARIVTIDIRTGKTRQYPYLLESASQANSEITALTNKTFLVLERDGNFGNGAGGGAVKRIYQIDLSGATDVSDPADGILGLQVGGKTLEQLTAGVADPAAVLAANNITPVSKSLVADILTEIPTFPHDKAEGLAVVDRWTLAISNDDDFGVGDDGQGHFIAKTLPSLGKTDFNAVYFIHLSKPLKLGDDHGRDGRGDWHDRN